MAQLLIGTAFLGIKKLVKLLKFLIVLTAILLLWAFSAQASGLHAHHQTGIASPFTLKAKSSNQPLHCLLNNHLLNHPCPHVKNGDKKVVRILADCGTGTPATSSGSAFSGKEVLMQTALQFPLSSSGGEVIHPGIFYQTAFPDPIDHPPQLA